MGAGASVNEIPGNLSILRNDQGNNLTSIPQPETVYFIDFEYFQSTQSIPKMVEC